MLAHETSKLFVGKKEIELMSPTLLRLIWYTLAYWRNIIVDFVTTSLHFALRFRLLHPPDWLVYLGWWNNEDSSKYRVESSRCTCIPKRDAPVFRRKSGSTTRVQLLFIGIHRSAGRWGRSRYPGTLRCAFLRKTHESVKICARVRLMYDTLVYVYPWARHQAFCA